MIFEVVTSFLNNEWFRFYISAEISIFINMLYLIALCENPKHIIWNFFTKERSMFHMWVGFQANAANMIIFFFNIFLNIIYSLNFLVAEIHKICHITLRENSTFFIVLILWYVGPLMVLVDVEGEGKYLTFYKSPYVVFAIVLQVHCKTKLSEVQQRSEVQVKLSCLPIERTHTIQTCEPFAVGHMSLVEVWGTHGILERAERTTLQRNWLLTEEKMGESPKTE